MLGIRKVIKTVVVGTCIGLASVNEVAKENYILAAASPGG